MPDLVPETWKRVALAYRAQNSSKESGGSGKDNRRVNHQSGEMSLNIDIDEGLSVEEVSRPCSKRSRWILNRFRLAGLRLIEPHSHGGKA